MTEQGSPTPESTPTSADGPPSDVSAPTRRKRGLLFYGCIAATTLMFVIVATAGLTAWWIKRQLNADPIQTVELTQPEEQVLEEKIRSLEKSRTPLRHTAEDGGEVELDQRLSITISERELNGLLHKNTSLDNIAALELAKDALAARVVIPLDDDLPILGGKTIRLKVAMKVELVDRQLQVTVRDVLVGGFPMPNAWLGGIKDIDLVERYFKDNELMRAFVDGIDELRIENGQIILIPAA